MIVLKGKYYDLGINDDNTLCIIDDGHITSISSKLDCIISIFRDLENGVYGKGALSNGRK